jgi:glycerol-3-phosphate acyltransferase PlsX
VIRVALDAMGGDRAPAVEVEGAQLALRDFPPTFLVQLVGRPEIIEPELARYPDLDRDRVEVMAAEEVIGMAESPIAAVRKKPGSSLVVGVSLHAQQAADAFISAGNTGALLAASTMLLGLHHGVERASVGAMFPTAYGPVMVADAGANVDCSARELVCFARLGSVYMRDVMGVSAPKIGLLNVGEEDRKGGAVVREAFDLLRNTAGLNFIGNIEGSDLLAGHRKVGHVDVAVCDGLVGNILLKFYESVGALLHRLFDQGDPALLRHPDLLRAFEFLDYSRFGGAPLLGVKGISIICHGSSPANAIKHAIRVAVHSVEVQLDEHIRSEFEIANAGPG